MAKTLPFNQIIKMIKTIKWEEREKEQRDRETERERERERERHKVKEKKQPRVVSTFLASTLVEVYMSKTRIAKGKPEQNLYAKPIENG